VLGPGSIDLPGLTEVLPTITFADGGKASGSSGCNSFTTTYTTSGSSLTFAPVASTQMACPTAQMAVETAFLERLAKTASYTVDGGGLTLADSAGATVLAFTAQAPASLDGTWNVIGYLQAEKNAFSSVATEAPVTAVFGPDGRVSGNTGCNSYSGPYTTGAGGSVTIGPLISTRMACTVEGLSAQEAAFLAAMEASSTVDVTARQASFHDANGIRTLEMTRAS
jgi:heat shock protein HslJ